MTFHDSPNDIPDPEVVPKAKRRKFSAKYKLRVLDEADKLKSKRTELNLWLSQNGTCPVCEQLLTEDTDWERHHIIQRVHGGPDTLDNLVLLHPTCHRQVHSLGLTVLSPRPIIGHRALAAA